MDYWIAIHTNMMVSNMFRNGLVIMIVVKHSHDIYIYMYFCIHTILLMVNNNGYNDSDNGEKVLTTSVASVELIDSYHQWDG